MQIHGLNIFNCPNNNQKKNNKKGKKEKSLKYSTETTGRELKQRNLQHLRRILWRHCNCWVAASDWYNCCCEPQQRLPKNPTTWPYATWPLLFYLSLLLLLPADRMATNSLQTEWTRWNAPGWNVAQRFLDNALVLFCFCFVLLACFFFVCGFVSKNILE